MKKPNLKHVFLLSKIVKKTGVKNLEIDYSKSAEEVGGALLFHILENLDQAETEIYELVASLLGISPEEAAEVNLLDLISEFKEIEGLNDFFSSLSQLMKLK